MKGSKSGVTNWKRWLCATTMCPQIKMTQKICNCGAKITFWRKRRSHVSVPAVSESRKPHCSSYYIITERESVQISSPVAPPKPPTSTENILMVIRGPPGIQREQCVYKCREQKDTPALSSLAAVLRKPHNMYKSKA